MTADLLAELGIEDSPEEKDGKTGAKRENRPGKKKGKGKTKRK